MQLLHIEADPDRPGKLFVVIVHALPWARVRIRYAETIIVEADDFRDPYPRIERQTRELRLVVDPNWTDKDARSAERLFGAVLWSIIADRGRHILSEQLPPEYVKTTRPELMHVVRELIRIGVPNLVADDLP